MFEDFDLAVGPGRTGLVGVSGAGRSTLLKLMAGALTPTGGRTGAVGEIGYLPQNARLDTALRVEQALGIADTRAALLAVEAGDASEENLAAVPQRLDVLDDALSVADNVARFAPAATDNEIRARLARFLFKGARANQPAGTLSGGERFRASPAALLLAEPAPRLLMLDEPTNNLDLASVRGLPAALGSYRGALLVAGHDVPFLESIGITRWLVLDGELRDTTVEEVRAGLPS